MSPYSGPEMKGHEIMALLEGDIPTVSREWLRFRESSAFPKGAPLVNQVRAFFSPMAAFLKKRHESRMPVPNEILLLVILKGIERTGTHTKSQLESALGKKLPD